MPLWFNKALNLTEGEIRSAMENSLSNKEAALFLGIHYNTYERYAKRFIDFESGLNLFKLHQLNCQKKRGKKNRSVVRNPDFKPFIKPEHRNTPANIFDILNGKHPNYDKKKLATKLIEELILPECCSQCKFDERRITDFQVPLVLIWIDGDTTNHALENLKFLCYNCYFLTWSDVKLKSFGANFKGFAKC